MGNVVSLRTHITYKNQNVYFKKQPNGTICFLIAAKIPTLLMGVGDDINEAVGKARDMIDKMEKTHVAEQD